MLGFVEKNLMSGETVIKKAELSKKFIYPPLIVFSPILFVFTVGFLWFGFADGGGVGSLVKSILMSLFAVAMFDGVAYLVLTRGRRKILRLGGPAITNKRILGISGGRMVLDAPLDSIDNVAVYGGMFGSLLGYGAVLVTLRGTVNYAFVGMVNPMEFKNEVMRILSEKGKS